MLGAVHKYVTLFWTNFDLCHTLSHISEPPIFSSTCIHTCVFTGRFVLVRGGSCLGILSRGFCLEGFVMGGFCLSRFLSEYNRYNRKLNITFHFRFHMYEQNLKSVTSHAPRPPLPLSHLLGTLPLERDVL